MNKIQEAMYMDRIVNITNMLFLSGKGGVVMIPIANNLFVKVKILDNDYSDVKMSIEDGLVGRERYVGEVNIIDIRYCARRAIEIIEHHLREGSF